MEKIYCGGFYVDDGAMEIRDGKKYLKTGGGGGVCRIALCLEVRASYEFCSGICALPVGVWRCCLVPCPQH